MFENSQTDVHTTTKKTALTQDGFAKDLVLSRSYFSLFKLISTYVLTRTAMLSKMLSVDLENDSKVAVNMFMESIADDITY